MIFTEVDKHNKMQQSANTADHFEDVPHEVYIFISSLFALQQWMLGGASGIVYHFCLFAMEAIL